MLFVLQQTCWTIWLSYALFAIIMLYWIWLVMSVTNFQSLMLPQTSWIIALSFDFWKARFCQWWFDETFDRCVMCWNRYDENLIFPIFIYTYVCGILDILPLMFLPNSSFIVPRMLKKFSFRCFECINESKFLHDGQHSLLTFWSFCVCIVGRWSNEVLSHWSYISITLYIFALC
jgi:hypothetical protein